ncbi:MAG: hypothetical protein ACTSYX_09200 [Candidatus Thorarchaeota archaeon]
MRKASLLTLLFVTVMVFGLLQFHPSTDVPAATSATVRHVSQFSPSGFDSENITVALLSPANQSELVGTVNITLNITSTNGPLNLTLFIEGEIYPAYNSTEIGPGEHNFTIDTTTLREGRLNFTFYLENRSYSPPDRESYHLIFLINNHGPPRVVMLYPGIDDVFTGLDNITLNITADYDQVYLNISVNGEITPEFNQTLVPVGVGNYTINGSRYDNGQNLIEVVVWTEEGLTAKASREVTFLDYVRFSILDLTQYSEVSGTYKFRVKVFTPFESIFFAAYVDGQLVPDMKNVTLSAGVSEVSMDTTWMSEGEHNFTFCAYDGIGHSDRAEMILVVNNHGAPSVSFVGPKQDIVAGMATFSVNIESTWDYVMLSVYVDDEVVPTLDNVTVAPGLYNFSFDVSAYSKWQHTVEVVVTTPEGLEAKTSRDFGFASMKIEEIASGVALLAVAFLIPLYRLKQRKPVFTMLLVNLLFFAVTAGLFVVLGMTTLELLVWHINLASIWAIGTALVFTNWLFHLILEEESRSSQ